MLIENPLCGNESFSKALTLSDGEIPRHSTPTQVREAIGPDRWEKAHKTILVRNPTSRFLSGAVKALNSSEEALDEAGAQKTFIDAIGRIREAERSERERLVDMLEVINKGTLSIVPVYMKPQKEWLSARFDQVIATHDIAGWFNVRAEGGCAKSNRFYRSPEIPEQVMISPDAEDLISQVYAEDIAFLKRLLVWSPIEGRIRLVGGYCPSCEKREVERMDLIDPTKKETTTTKEVTKKETTAPKSNRKRKRARQSGDSKT